jgi:O-acetyl-ADP-ribose deacetylase (regulator of RNase III)
MDDHKHMKEIKGNIFDVKDADAICVTTNGVVKANGELVMGKGIALEFAKRYPGLAAHFGKVVKYNGNRVFMFMTEPDQAQVVSFPTKNHWKDGSDIDLIIQSAKELVYLTTRYSWVKVVLPRPGCGLGGLDWEKEVKPAIENILDDRFYIITPFEPNSEPSVCHICGRDRLEGCDYSINHELNSPIDKFDGNTKHWRI